MTAQPTYRTRLSGDALLLVEFEARIDPLINAHAVALATAIAGAGLAGVLDVLPTYCSVGVHLDPLRLDLDALLAAIDRLSASTHAAHEADAPLVEVPVCYGGALGPDLAEVAAFAGCDEQDVVALHAGRIYHVYMLGFAPGYPYLGTVDERIAMPRRAIPRKSVPAGSVGIGGAQTGVYSISTPGGWHILGRTPLRLFDPASETPFLMRAGDRVRFVPITEEEYARRAADQARPSDGGAA